MSKLLTLALVLAALAVFTRLSAGQDPKPVKPKELVQIDSQAKQTAINVIRMTGTVTQVNGKLNSFTISANGTEATFSAKRLRVLPKVGEAVDVTYTQTAGGGINKAAESYTQILSSTTVLNRPIEGTPPVTPPITKADDRTPNVSIPKKPEPPKSRTPEEQVKDDINDRQDTEQRLRAPMKGEKPPPPPKLKEGKLPIEKDKIEAMKEEPGVRRMAAPPKTMTGTVTQVNGKGNSFAISANGREATFSAKALRVLPKVGETIDVTYTETETAGTPVNLAIKARLLSGPKGG